MKRRKFVQITGGITVAAGSISTLFASCDDPMMDTMMNMDKAPEVVEGLFNTMLPVPNAVSVDDASLTAQLTTTTVFQGKTSNVLGYQPGSMLGPTLKAATGDGLNIVFQNNLFENSNIHWHGLITPAAMDGHPKDIVQSGNSFNYTFPVINRSGTYWYHPHPDMRTAKQAYEGLAGLFLVTDVEEQALGLPSGEYELPLVVQDKRANTSGNFYYLPSGMDLMNGLLGESVLVNGVHAPFTEVVAGYYRLRVLNGSNGRIYNLGMSNGAPLTIIGTDGGLLSAPEDANSILLSPGERVDLLLSFDGLPIGTEVFLESKTFENSGYQGQQAFRIMKFQVKAGQGVNFTVPAILSTYATIPENQATRQRFFDITNGGGHGGHGGGMVLHNINGRSYDESRIDETVTAGTTEIWSFDNVNGVDPHPMHLHGALFQVLDRTGGRGQIYPHEKGWKDTVLVMPGERVRVIVPFSQNTGIYVFHCHNLEHEDTGMMLQMEIS